MHDNNNIIFVLYYYFWCFRWYNVTERLPTLLLVCSKYLIYTYYTRIFKTVRHVLKLGRSNVFDGSYKVLKSIL